jgi:uncharacterized linocin/CFP29 family protein
MNNLHRELAPVSAEAWDQIADEVLRTFTRFVAGRRVVDVIGPAGIELSAVGTGHTTSLGAADGVSAALRTAAPLVELRAPFTVTRAAVDDVERGSRDSDWQPVKDAARALALAEDHAVFNGRGDAGIDGVRPRASNAPVSLPADVREYPDAVAAALGELRLAGVNGPYSLLLSAEAYTAVAETADHGYPVLEHLSRVLGAGEIIWAPAIEGGVLVSTRGGDFELYLGQDVSIGYLSHDADTVQLYLQESLTFLVRTDEAAVVLT